MRARLGWTAGPTPRRVRRPASPATDRTGHRPGGDARLRPASPSGRVRVRAAVGVPAEQAIVCSARSSSPPPTRWSPSPSPAPGRHGSPAASAIPTTTTPTRPSLPAVRRLAQGATGQRAAAGRHAIGAGPGPRDRRARPSSTPVHRRGPRQRPARAGGRALRRRRLRGRPGRPSRQHRAPPEADAGAARLSGMGGTEPYVVVVGGANIDVKARSSSRRAPNQRPRHRGPGLRRGGAQRRREPARLGTTTHLVTAVGTDLLGDQLIQHRGRGVGVDRVARVDLPTGSSQQSSMRTASCWSRSPRWPRPRPSARLRWTRPPT